MKCINGFISLLIYVSLTNDGETSSVQFMYLCLALGKPIQIAHLIFRELPI